MTDPSPKLCECGCGEPAPIAKVTKRQQGQCAGKAQRFIRGHSNSAFRVLSSSDYTVTESGYKTPCHLWKGYLNDRGYGRVMIRGRNRTAHGAFWEEANGQLLKGLELDHLCQNPSCVNIEHLEAVTHLENMRRGRNVRMTSQLKQRIIEMRASGASYAVVAKETGLSKTLIFYVYKGRRWGHL